MDPEQCLVDAQDAATEGDVATAMECLDNYRSWRGQGGFEPDNGDKRARRIRASVGRQGRAFERD